MNIIKVTTINDDGSVNFEGLFGPEEVRFVLEVGTNFLLQSGASPFVEGDEDEDDEDDLPPFKVEGPKTQQ